MNINILSIIESLSNKKSLNKEIIFNIIEESLKKSIKKKIQDNIDIKIIFNKTLGTFNIFKLLKIVDHVNNFNKEILLEDANKNKKKYILGDIVKINIDNIILNRIVSNYTKKIIFDKIRKIEKLNLINKFNCLIGKILIGKIIKICKNKIIFDIGYEYEAVLYKKDILFNDYFIIEKKKYLLIYKTEYRKFGLQIIVNRSHIFILYKLIIDYFNKIYKKKIIIKNIIREPGIKSIVFIDIDKNLYLLNIENKININIKKISKILNNEKIIIIIWNKNIIKLIKNFMYSIKIKNFKFINKNNILIFIKKKDEEINIKNIVKNLFYIINNKDIKINFKIYNKEK